MGLTKILNSNLIHKNIQIKLNNKKQIKTPLNFLRKNLLRFISYIFFGVAIFYVFNYIRLNWLKLGEGIPTFNLKYFILYFFFLQLYFLYQVNIWRLVLNSLNTKLNYIESAYMYFSNSLLAYTPGKIANALGMATIAKRSKISIPNVITTVILSQIYSLISGTLLISLFSLISDFKIIDNLILENIWILSIASLIGVILIHPSIQKYTITFIKNITGKKIKNPNNSFKVSISHIIQYLIGWLIYCYAFTYLIKSLNFDSQILLYPIVVVIYISSYLCGLLSFVVPAGFGILEAGLIYGFNSIIETNQIILLILLFRLGNIFSVLISWLIVKCYIILQNKKISIN